MPFDWSKLVAVVPEIVEIVTFLIEKVKPEVDADRWNELGPEIQSLIEKTISGEDFSHSELMQYIPDKGELELRALQLKKKAERIEKGLPVV